MDTLEEHVRTMGQWLQLIKEIRNLMWFAIASIFLVVSVRKFLNSTRGDLRALRLLRLGMASDTGVVGGSLAGEVLEIIFASFDDFWQLLTAKKLPSEASFGVS